MHLRNRPQWGSVVRPDARFDRLGHSDRVTTSRAAAHEPIAGDAANDAPVAVPAAAVAVVREGVGGPEVLLVRRRRGTTFGGAWAFPGGALEPADGAGDARQGVAAARAATRELAEETGVFAAPDDVVALLGPIITADLERRFTVWFFTLRAERAIEIRLNKAELTSYQWLAPADALHRSAAGSLRLPPATRAALEALSSRVDASPACASRRAGEGGVRLG